MPNEETAVAYIPQSAIGNRQSQGLPIDLSPVAAQINSDFSAYKFHEKEATKYMLKIGLMLEYAKQQLPHGQLNKWIEENLSVTYRHAHRFRQLAQAFIKTNQLAEGEMFALVDPANSQDALADKLQQMAFDFLGDKAQGELFEEYGIRFRDREKKAPRQLANEPLPEGETAEHMDAAYTWTELGNGINTWGLERETWAYLKDVERENLYGIVHELSKRLKASLKG